MVHIPVKFQENTAMRLRVTEQKLKVTDRQANGGGGGRGVSISPVPAGDKKYMALIRYTPPPPPLMQHCFLRT